MTLEQIMAAARESTENEHYLEEDWSFDPLAFENIKEEFYAD